VTALAKAVRAHLKGSPQPPVWSLIATVFGDMAAPRGGALSTEGLIRILALAGAAPPAVRTALSRLVADGWLSGMREGRRSSYSMTERAGDETAEASRRIYALPDATFGGGFEIAILTGGAAVARQALRTELLTAGFGALQPDCLIRPARQDRPPPAPRPGLSLLVNARTMGDPASLIAAAYDLPGLSARHDAFLRSFGGLLTAAGDPLAAPETALAARLLLIHGWRRLALRDPGLPLPLLPEHLRRAPAVFTFSTAYRALLPGSETALDAMAGTAVEPRRRFVRFGVNM
jgi:phenylacetic acid degradation operon negative regulatory protein